MTAIDPNTQCIALDFLGRVAARYPVDYGLLYGSRARLTHSADSDADIAVVLRGPHGQRAQAAIGMAGIAFDVLMDTGLLVQALPLWHDDLDAPAHFSNPALLENIQREGVRLVPLT
jgi:uncharacterized protein